MKKLTQTSLSVGLLLVPALAYAATVTALDTVAGLASEVTLAGLPPKTQATLTVEDPSGDARTYGYASDQKGMAAVWIPGNDLTRAGAYALKTNAYNQTVLGSLSVYPDTVDTARSFIAAAKTTVNVGEEVAAVVSLLDRFGNPLPGRSVELIGSRPGDRVDAVTRETDQYGEQHFVVRASEAGMLSLRAIDLISGKTLNDAVQISAGSALGFGGPAVAYSAPQQFYRGTPSPYGASVLPGSLRAQTGEPPRFDGIKIEIVGQENAALPVVEQFKAQSMLLTALDQYGNQFFDFTGTVYLATTDPEATLPLFGVYSFAFEDEGRKMLTLGLKFSTAGQQTMVLTSSPDQIPENLEEALGYLTVNVQPQQIVQPSKKPVIITFPSESATLGKSDLLNGNQVLVEGTGREFINITVTGGTQEEPGETDREGNFSVPITLDTSKAEHTITVNDLEAPQNTSKRNFAIDITAPEIESAAFAPENPVEGTDVLLVVKTEPDVTGVTVELEGEPQALTPVDGAPGKFQILLTAPQGGVYEAIVSVTDPLENVATKTLSLPVNLKGLPAVGNVIAEAQINAIALRWDPVTGSEIDAYRIYVGTAPDEFLYTLDTDRPTAAATVAGLRPGTTYYFAVTALQGPRESEQKSDIVEATVLGVKLDVAPQDGALFVEWTALQGDMPLSSFLLEYGIEPDQFTEKRTLNGELRAFTLRDLVNGVTYYLKLSPITTTGELLNDLAATGQGTPTGRGYTAGIADPVPFDLHGSAPPRPKPPLGAPLSEQGVPAWMLWSILGISVLLFRWHVRRKNDRQMTVAFLQAMDSRYHR